MIQSYLKTGMVFYDSMDKQHFRNECCKETFYHYIDETHFPSFQFITEMPISLEGIIIELYDLNDNLIGTFDVADFNAVNTIYHGVNGYQYVHNVVDIIGYPVGYDNETDYYIKICFLDLPVQDIHSTETKGNDDFVITGSKFTPVYYYNKKTYNVWMQRNENGYDSRAMIWAYDHLTNTESANYDLRSVGEVSGITDNHPTPSVIVADDGHILVAQEFPRIGVGNHNDAITIKRSDNAEDETSWVNAIAKNANFWTYIGSWQPDNSARLAYPTFHKDHSGNIYVICRRYDGADGRYDRIYKSIDHGINWDAGHDIIDGGAGIWMYPTSLLNGTDDTLRLAVYAKVDATGIKSHIFYLESDDGGITWRDITSTFSKDTVASGALTWAELINVAYDFIVVEATDIDDDNIDVFGGTMNDVGTPCILTREYTAVNDVDHRMYYWDGNSWENTIIIEDLPNTHFPVLIHREGNIYECYLRELNGANYDLSLYRTTDLITWVKIKTVKATAGLTANTFFLNVFTQNYKDADYWMFLGIYGTDADYSDIFYEVLDISIPKCWYSEAFKVCDCEVEGVGDGINLIENGWMEDWLGTGDWHDYPIGWDLVSEDVDNYVVNAGGECQMISDGTQAVRIEQSILIIGEWYVFTINITAVVAGGIQIQEGGVNIGSLNTTGVHNIVFEVTSGTQLRIFRNGVTDITFTNVRVEEFVGFEFCDMMTLNWWSDCDWDSIIYQDGFRNSLVLGDSQGVIALDIPKEDIVINPDERLGEMFVHDVIIKKRYKFNIRIPEYLWNALIRLAAYGSEMPNFHAWITLPDGSACPMSEVAILGEWDTGNCMNTFTIEFVDNDEYPVVATNCCDDEDISEV